MKCLICQKFIETPLYRGVYIYPLCSKKCFNEYREKENKKARKERNGNL